MEHAKSGSIHQKSVDKIVREISAKTASVQEQQKDVLKEILQKISSQTQIDEIANKLKNV